MADQSTEALFLHDNLLSDDDWGSTLKLVDMSDLTSSNPSTPSDDFYLGDDARYEQEFSSYTTHDEGLRSNLENVTLLPPSSNDDIVDELLQDLMNPMCTTECKNVSDDVLLQQMPPEELERRFSAHAPSSSAYSSGSDSCAPSPSERFSEDGSCSSGEFLEQNMVKVDLTLGDDTELFSSAVTSTSDVVLAGRRENGSSSCIWSGGKTNRCENATSISGKIVKASELELAVKKACEETNRLLRLHKRLSGEEAAQEKATTHQHTQQHQDILQSLCEETIFNKTSIAANRGTVNSSNTLPKKRSQKRKASTLQDAIDRLQSANKSLCVGTLAKGSEPTSFSQTALVSTSAVKAKPQSDSSQLHSVQLKTKEQCILVTPTPPPQPQSIILNGNQTYTLTPTATSSAGNQPLQFYIKQEPPTFQPCHVVGNLLQPQTMQNVLPFGNQKVIVSSGTTPNAAFNGSIVGPKDLLCNNGQTIVIQQPATQSINISNMKPGSEPMVLSQSDLSRLATQGVIKFSSNRVERNLVPGSSDQNKSSIKNSAPKPTQQAARKHSIFPAVPELLPNEAAGIIEGTSVFVNGVDNQPQRGELDVKALKRHQRMIKNRASACESRQRRKEYVKTLEDQVTEVAEENKSLRERNGFLLSKVHELEIENKNLRGMIGISQSQQKKAACFLTLMLFFGFNVFHIGLFGGESPLPVTNHNAVMSSMTKESHFGRHLLSLNDEDAEKQQEEKVPDGSDKGLIVLEKESTGVAEMIKRYKDKHLENFLQLLSETTSNSVKRMLRRKLKEELGINIPLPISRSRRIAYTPQSSRQRPGKSASAKGMSGNGRPIAPLSVTPAGTKPDVKIPPSLPRPCELPTIEDAILNETETSRVNDDLTQWANRYTVERKEKAQRSNAAAKKPRNTKSPTSRYEEFENSTATNEIAVYTRPNVKYSDFFEAINRRNDTFYIVSLNRDHLLLPVSARNSSSRMKMALVMPAITSKEHSPHGRASDEYETMIHIECEVLNTRMFDLKRKDVPDYMDVNPAKATLKTLDNASNDTTTLQSPESQSRQRSSKSRNRGRKHVKFAGKPVVNEKQDAAEKPEEEQDAVVSDVSEFEFYKAPLT